MSIIISHQCSPYLYNFVVASDNLHDADVLRGDEDPDGQGEGLDDLRPPHVVQDEEAVRQVAGQEQPSHKGTMDPVL